MKLTVSQCLELIKAPVNAEKIKLAQKQEERLVMHCEPIMDLSSSPAATEDFLAWVKSFLPNDKYERFAQLFTFPIETVDSTEAIFDELSKFFNAPDQNVKFEFSNSSYEDDFLSYLESSVEESFWKAKGLKALKTGINSLLVVDLPSAQRELRPEPYFYFLQSSCLYDLVINKENNTVEYVIFWQKDGSLLIIDEVAYRKFIQLEDKGDWQLSKEGEFIHSRYVETTDEKNNTIYGDLINGLGYTPVCSFYRHTIKGSEGINKKGPLTSCLGKLDWLLFWKTSKKYLDLYGAWPIIVSYSSQCEYRDERGNECNEGYVSFDYEDASVPGGHRYGQKECPACKKRGLIGAGSHWTVDPPKDKDDVDLMQNPVKFIEITNDKLEYGVTEIIRLEAEIKKNSAGAIDEATKEQINEKQVKSQYEAQKSILDTIREQFEQTQKFAYETCARLRYGSLFLRANVYLGKEYFLQSPQDLAVEYAESKKAGLPQYEIARIRETYSKTKFKNDPGQFQRSYILSQLEPFPDSSINDLKALGLQESDPVNFYLKLDFVSFIAKFEREQMNIVEFGSLLQFQAKITIIQTKLLEYVNANLTTAKASAQTYARPDDGTATVSK